MVRHYLSIHIKATDRGPMDAPRPHPSVLHTTLTVTNTSSSLAMRALGWLTQALMLEENKILSRKGSESSVSVSNIHGKSLHLLSTGFLFYLGNTVCHFPPPVHYARGRSVQTKYDKRSDRKLQRMLSDKAGTLDKT